jgi:hypothetical protein
LFSLHLAATTLFVVSTLLSTWDRPGLVQWLGFGLAALWVAVGAIRFLRR